MPGTIGHYGSFWMNDPERRLRTAIAKIAAFATSQEMRAAIEADIAKYPFAAASLGSLPLADFEAGYDECVTIARAALNEQLASPRDKEA